MKHAELQEMAKLAEKYLNGQASAEEEQRLHEWYDRWEDDELHASSRNRTEDDIRMVMLEKILKQIRSSADPLRSSSDPRAGAANAAHMVIPATKHRPARTRILAAASLLLILAGAAWFWLQQGRRATSITLANHSSTLHDGEDLLPGRQGAILTLGDGSSVLLDSAANGVVARQDNVQAVKKDGRLVYREGAGAKAMINTMTTPAGRQYNLVLEDGTRVWLDAASSITFPTAFTTGERKVSVTGEAYFEVASDPSRPFIVSVNNTAIRVLGTSFNVNAYADNGLVRTTLLDGRVQANNNGQSILLKPGQQAITGQGTRLSEDVDLEEIMAWKNGRFYCSGASLESIMQQAARWYDAEVVFEDRIPDQYTVDMSMDVPLSDLLRFLELSGGVHFTIEGRKIIVRK